MATDNKQTIKRVKELAHALEHSKLLCVRWQDKSGKWGTHAVEDVPTKPMLEAVVGWLNAIVRDCE